MILKRVQLRNIRSYVELKPFQFPDGTLLFYGGVGSGKSSLLYAIEFALFGLGELKGPDLLRNGATEGDVSLAFEEDGKEYIVHRELRRRGTNVSQAEGAISENGELHSYSVTDMKLRVLELLKLNEKPEPSTSSVIYRYGIFTPQEEIKRIMEASYESRLETLRRAFRLEKYITVRGNAQVLSYQLEKVEIKVLEKKAEGLDEKKGQCDSLAKQIEENNNRLVRLRNELGKIDAALDTLHEKKKKLEEDQKKIHGYQAKIPLIKKQCEQDKQLVDRLTGELTKLELEKSKFIDELKQLQSLSKPADKSEDQLKAELKQLEEKSKALVAQRGANEKSLQNYEILIDKRVCPTCERPIEDPSVYTERLEKMHQEVDASFKKEQEMEGGKRSFESLLQDLRQYNVKIQNLPRLQKEIEDKTNDIANKTKEIQQVKSRLSESQKDLTQLEKLVKANEGLLKAFDQTEQEIRGKSDLRSGKDKEIALLEQKNSNLEVNRRQLEGEIREGENALSRIGFYHEVIKYLEQYFIPTIERIERMVLQKLHEDFNDAFQKYFSMIIGFTEIEAYIDEDFSLVVRQGGYEMPYRSLSGGERTSLALAYRLALNHLIRRLSKLERGLLILDEPTEGLSYAQVLSLREVFDDLNCDQIILVSHESQFLGFSDKVFRIDKVNHASTVSPF